MEGPPDTSSPPRGHPAHLVGRHGAAVTFTGTATGPGHGWFPPPGSTSSRWNAPLRPKVSLETVTAPIAAVRSISACRAIVSGTDVVLGMGAYVSVPVGLAGARARRPLVIHEQDAVPGLANRVVARWAQAVTLSFEDSGRRTPRPCAHRAHRESWSVTRSSGVVRRSRALAVRACIEFGLEAGRRTIVVFGGSQGAVRLNAAAIGLIALLPGADLQVLVLSGPAHEEAPGRRIHSRPVTWWSTWAGTSIAWSSPTRSPI